MPTIRLQHPTPGKETRAAELCVIEDGSVMGLIRPDPKTKNYRYFPGKENEIAYQFQHRDVSELIAIITGGPSTEELEQKNPAKKC